MVLRENHRHYYWLAYSHGAREGRTWKESHLRDGGAAAELGALLVERGLRYGRLIPNRLPRPEEFREKRAELEGASHHGRRHVEDVVTYREIQDSFLEPGDLVVVPTRPPLNDLDHQDKVRSQPGFTTLEQKIFRECRDYLDVCSRSHVRLTPAAAGLLPPDLADRADITFRQVKEPWYRVLKRLDGRVRPSRFSDRARRTAAYLLYLPEVKTLRRAGLLVAFGMGGDQTLVFAHRLRTDLESLLDRPGFTMVEMTAPDDATAWGGLAFAHDWKMEPVLQMECFS
jgi:hypothetical protein